MCKLFVLEILCIYICVCVCVCGKTSQKTTMINSNTNMIYIYIYIYIYTLCVYVCLPPPPVCISRMWDKVSFSGEFNRFLTELSFFQTGCHHKIEKPSLYYCTLSRRKNSWMCTFLKSINVKCKQTCPGIELVSLSPFPIIIGNHFTKSTPIYIYIYIYIYVHADGK